jgi:hypothetical protein
VIDYAELLKKYMTGVMEAEGVAFVGFVGDITDEERAELRRLEKEIREE